jgi:hypothetical protein
MLKAFSGKKNRYPTKNTINLAFRERALFRPKIVIPVLALLVLLGVFSKFAVLDLIGQVRQAQETLVATELELKRLQVDNANSGELMREYKQYSYSGFSPEEKMLVDRMDILILIEQHLMTVAQVSAISIKENTVALHFSDLTLQEAADLIIDLNASPMVQDVFIYTATSQEKKPKGMTNVITMTINLKQVDKGGEDS